MKKPVRRKKRVYPSCTGRPADKKEAMPKKWRGPSHSEEPTAEEIALSDALAVQALYATAGQSGSHRIVSALRAIEAWLREGGAL